MIELIIVFFLAELAFGFDVGVGQAVGWLMTLYTIINPIFQTLKMNIPHCSCAVTEREQGVFFGLIGIKANTTWLLWILDFFHLIHWYVHLLGLFFLMHCSIVFLPTYDRFKLDFDFT